MTPRSTKGRAPSCTRTTLHSSRSARSPARTESPRWEPPETTVKGEGEDEDEEGANSADRKPGGCRASSGGSTSTICATSGCNMKGCRARSTMGTPRIRRYCLTVSPPTRAPRPAATTTTPTSRGKSPYQLFDVVETYQRGARHLHRAAGGAEHPVK